MSFRLLPPSWLDALRSARLGGWGGVAGEKPLSSSPEQLRHRRSLCLECTRGVSREPQKAQVAGERNGKRRPSLAVSSRLEKPNTNTQAAAAAALVSWYLRSGVWRKWACEIWEFLLQGETNKEEKERLLLATLIPKAEGDLKLWTASCYCIVIWDSFNNSP